MRGVRLASIVLASTVVSVLPAAAEWRRIDTPNFVVVGDVNARTLRDIALRFEGFREIFTRLMSERATATPVPTVVVVFPSDKAFTPYKPLYQGKPRPSAGYFDGGRDINYITLVSTNQEEAVRIVFHEYAHLIVANLMRNVPPWLNEGLAEFYSTFELNDGGREALVGAYVPEHVLRLRSDRPLKLHELLSVDHGSPHYNERNRATIFYAQSWALVHRLLRGEPSRAQELGRYLDALTRGSASIAAWKEVFGDADLDRELANYVRQDQFRAVRYKFTAKVAKLDLSARPLAASDAEAILAGLLLQQQRLEEAAPHIGAAEKLAPSAALVNRLSALHDVARGKFDDASRRLLATVESGDWLSSYLGAICFAQIAEAERGSLTPEQLAAARTFFERVRSQRGEFANAFARKAMLETSVSGTASAETRKDIELARQLAPGREDYAFAHAHILARLGEFLQARQVLGPMMSTRYTPGIREAARRLMSAVLELEKAREANASMTRLRALAAEDMAAAATSDIPRTGTTSGGDADLVRPDFRELRPGEERLEGVLERIDCSADGAATFQLRTLTGPAQAAAARLEKVDFITYRDDLTGSVACGPLKPALPVYVTWQGTTAAGIKAVVAVEFLPK